MPKPETVWEYAHQENGIPQAAELLKTPAMDCSASESVQSIGVCNSYHTPLHSQFKAASAWQCCIFNYLKLLACSLSCLRPRLQLVQQGVHEVIQSMICCKLLLDVCRPTLEAALMDLASCTSRSHPGYGEPDDGTHSLGCNQLKTSAMLEWAKRQHFQRRMALPCRYSCCLRYTV